MAKKAHVNETCIGCGACTAVCPSVFEIGVNGTAENVLGEDTEIPVDLEDEVVEAASSCPVGAIDVTE